MDAWQAAELIGGIVGVGLIGFLVFSGFLRLRGQMGVAAQQRRARQSLRAACDIAMEKELQEYLRKTWPDILGVPRGASLPELSSSFNARLEALRASPDGSTHAQRTLLKAYTFALTERRAQRQVAR